MANLSPNAPRDKNNQRRVSLDFDEARCGTDAQHAWHLRHPEYGPIDAKCKRAHAIARNERKRRKRKYEAR